jgi:hypothetical protein
VEGVAVAMAHHQARWAKPASTARACSHFLDQAGSHGELGADLTTQSQLAVSDWYGEVEAAMLSAPSAA